MSEPAVRVDRLEKTLGSNTVLRGISFEARAGEIFGLLGPNGAGKTTTLRIIGTLLAPDKGSVAVLGFAALSFLGRGPGYGAVPTPTAPPTGAAVTSQPSMPLDTTRWIPFAGSLYGYSVAYPLGWQTSAATELWAGQTSYDMWASSANAPWADKTYDNTVRLEYRRTALVFHRHRATIGGLFTQQMRGGRGRALMCRRYSPYLEWGWRDELGAWRDLGSGAWVVVKTAGSSLGSDPDGRARISEAYVDFVRKLAQRVGFVAGTLGATSARARTGEG